MNLIPTRVHGIIDYLMGILLIGSPWLLGFGKGGGETFVLVAMGVLIIAYSLCTTYEYGVFHKLSMPVHLGMDMVGGLFLVMSPWLFGFGFGGQMTGDAVYLPHILFGMMEVGLALVTSKVPGRRYVDYLVHHRHHHVPH